MNDATATPFRAARPGGLAATLRLLVLAALLWVSGCASAPSPLPRVVSQSLDGGSASAIGRTAALLQQSGVAGASTTSTVVPLGRGEDAWAARLMLAERAERSLDVQYYIFRSDASGRALLAALERAAARGVRVRLLLDDWGAKPDAATLQQLAAQPGFEVRLYNPLAHGGSTVLSLLLDFERTQRRMHNKLLVADGRAAIAGGRNVGDEYFARRPGLEFGDLDLLAVGPVVPQLAAGFDRFWNESPSAVVPPTPAAAAPGKRAGSPPAAGGGGAGAPPAPAGGG
ncbi:MAG: phospholipase D-like domain-containing protein, partial [Betaproteobacteria bacterium]